MPGDEPITEQGCDGEDMVGETAGVGVLLADAPPRPGHQQPVEDVERFVDRSRDGLGCEGSEPVRDMGVGLEAGFAAIASVDEVHRFALACGWEELAVAGGGEAQTPEAGHGQLRLCFDHHGQGPVYRLAFDMPARDARELEEVMGVGGLGHLAETQIEPLGEEDVQESDPVLAWRARAQVGESVGETGGGIHLQQDTGMRQLSIADRGPSARPELSARSSWGFVSLHSLKCARTSGCFPSAGRSPTVASLTKPT